MFNSNQYELLNEKKHTPEITIRKFDSYQANFFYSPEAHEEKEFLAIFHKKAQRLQRMEGRYYKVA